VRVGHLSPAQDSRLRDRGQQLAENNAGWDTQLLALELKELTLQFSTSTSRSGGI